MDVWNQSNTEGEKPEGGQPDGEAAPELELNVSTDRVTAYLRVKPASPGQEVPSSFILDFLEKNRIVYGLLLDDIESFCREKRYYAELVCARGLEPVDEEDAQMEYHFRTEQDVMPKQKEDGTVDFRELGLVQNVAKGDVLCRIVMPAKGKDGIDIYNHPIRFKKGRVPAFPSGSNTVISEDRLTMTAAIDGCIEYKNNVLNVNSMFVVRGDVDGSSGNIDFLGSVTVQGDVREGFSVKAGKDITIRGMVEGADVEAGGNIAISNGMKGMGRGKLRAKGNIVGKYFENVVMECGGDVYADVIMNSIVTAAGSVVLRGRQALLIGGKVRAGRQVYAGSIGSGSSIRTEIVVESDQLQALLVEEGESVSGLQAQMDFARREENALRDRISEYTRALSAKKDAARVQPLLKSAIVEKSRNAETIRTLDKKIREARDRQESYMNFRVAGVHTIYSGTKITIGSYTQLLNSDYSYTKFYSDRERLESGPLLPSDILSY